MKKSNLLLLILMLPLGLFAQYVVPLTATQQSNTRIPWKLHNLSVVDNHLFAYSDGLLLSTPLTEGYLRSLQPDTLIAPLVPGADYVVRNPRDSILYFTRMGEDGITNLYTYSTQRLRKVQKIDIHGWHRDICHPTFSPSGNMMIFTSKGKVGLGGYDLWCSLWNGHRWTRPINMGNAINTPGDEVNPVFYHTHLIFSSDSVGNRGDGYHLYAVTVRDATSVDEIIFDNYTVQTLPYPINGSANDQNMAFDTRTDQGFWISNRSGQKELYSFKGLLNGVMLQGTVADMHHRPIPQAAVTLSVQGRVAGTTLTNDEGKYHLFLLPNDNYRILVTKNDYFRHESPLRISRSDEKTLINPLTHDIALSSLPTNHPIMLQHIFNQSADIELSDQAPSELEPIINFLRDNPHLTAELTIYCDYSDDESFNNTIIEHRINALQRYLSSYLPQRGQFSLKNGNKMEEIESSESGANFIFLTIRNIASN